VAIQGDLPLLPPREEKAAFARAGPHLEGPDRPGQKSPHGGLRGLRLHLPYDPADDPGVVPVGYFDGYDRGLSNAAHVLVKGRRAPVRGRVAMDFIMADITDIPGVKLEDEVTLLGADGRERITADDLAGLAGTISYEILSRINPLVPRIVV